MSRFNRSRAVRVLIEAYKQGGDGKADKVAGTIHGLDPRTIRSYRARLESDPELARAFEAKKAVIDADRAVRDVAHDRAIEERRHDHERVIEELCHSNERTLLEAINAGYRYAAAAFQSDLGPEEASKLLHVLQGGKKLAADDALANRVVGDLADPEPEGENVVPFRKTP